jgi:hypothetical protein
MSIEDVPVEVVREPVRKIIYKNSGTHQNVLILFQSLDLKKVPLLFKKIMEHIKTF